MLRAMAAKIVLIVESGTLTTKIRKRLGHDSANVIDIFSTMSLTAI